MQITLATETNTDLSLEQQLDEYLQLLTDNHQTEAIARLEQILAQLHDATPLSSQVRTFSYRIRNHLMYEQPELALQQAKQLLQLAQTAEQPDAIAEALLTKFNVLQYMQYQQIAVPPLQQPDINTAASQLEQQLTLVSNLRIRYIGHILLAGMYMEQNSDYETALAHYIEAYQVVQNTNDNQTAKRLIFLDEHISRVHLSLDNPTTAYSYINQAIERAVGQNITMNLSVLYLLKGYIEYLLQQPEQELRSYQLSLHWAEQMQQHDNVLSAMNNIGLFYQANKQYDKALAILSTALAKAQSQLGVYNNYNIHNINLSMGLVQIESGSWQPGLALIEQSLAYFRQTQDHAELQNILGWVADSYQLAGRYQEQAELLLEQRALREEVFQTERDQRINKLQQQFEIAEQIQKNRLLEQKNINQAHLLENKRLQHNFMLLFALTMTLVAVLLYLLLTKLRRRSYRMYQDNLQLQHQSLHDPLTGLLNRRALLQHMTTPKTVTQRLKPQSAVFLLMDIDHFKQLNDTYGHAVGDAVLVEVAKRLSQLCRGADLLVRWGGEEFLLYLPQTDTAMLPILAQRLLHTITATPVSVGELQLYISLTGGAVSSYCPEANNNISAPDWEQLVQLADAALYYGKQQGRNRICCINKLLLPLNEALQHLQTDHGVHDANLRITTICGPATGPLSH